MLGHFYKLVCPRFVQFSESTSHSWLCLKTNFFNIVRRLMSVILDENYKRSGKLIAGSPRNRNHNCNAFIHLLLDTKSKER